MLNENEIKDYFLLVNSHAKKELGQNFLINETTSSNIVDSLEVKSSDKVLEIGPGLGALTYFLVNKSKKYVAVEYDEKFVEFLNKNFKETNLKVVKNNILKFKDFEFNKIIGNLPYYISTDILEFLIKNFEHLEIGVFMVQKEFFERITASNKRDKTPLNYMLEYMFDIKKLFLVKKNEFFPQPTIDSVVFKIIRKKEKEFRFAGFLNKIITISFINRRKNLNNNLKGLIKDEDMRNKIFNDSNISPLARAEDLNLNDFINLANNILKEVIINL